jgi:predicted ATP-grasp superfamily ATP-dependent carboligase
MKDPNGVYIALLVLVLILVGSNLIMFGLARSMRNTKINWFKDSSKSLTNSWSRDDKDAAELSKRIKEMKEKEEQE